MKNKSIALILILIFLMTIISGCSSEDTAGLVVNDSIEKTMVKTIKGVEVSQDDEGVQIFPELGFGMVVPQKWMSGEYTGIFPIITENGFVISYLPKVLIDELESSANDSMTEEEYLEIFKGCIPFVKIFYTEKGDDKALADNSAGYGSTDKIMDYQKKTYYISYNESVDPSSNEKFTEETAAEYKGLADTISELKDGIIIFPIEKQEEGKLSSLAALSGVNALDNSEEITAEIFKDYDITMVNIWATWCGPCVGELPDLQELYEGLPENANMITICTDGLEAVDTCKEILRDCKATFKTVAGNSEMVRSLLPSVTAYPTTVFVDKEGKVVGNEVLGAQKAAFYLNEIKSRL